MKIYRIMGFSMEQEYEMNAMNTTIFYAPSLHDTIDGFESWVGFPTQKDRTHIGHFNK